METGAAPRYAEWLVETFPMVFDRLTNAISFLVFDLLVSKLLLVVLLVALTGTSGKTQAIALACAAVVNVFVLAVYLPFNSMLSNIRELLAGASHVVVICVPLYDRPRRETIRRGPRIG